MEHTINSLTDQEKQFIIENYRKYTNHELAKMLGRSETSIQRQRKLAGLSKQNTGRFKKGMVSHNKGKKQIEFMSPEAIERTKASRFKKGNIPHNAKGHYDGEVTVRRCKGRLYKYVRISLRRWRELHRVTWEQHHGAIPKGYNVQFRDGNSLNCDISNLYLISRKEQIKLNTIQRFPPEVKKTIRVLGKLRRKIKHYEEQD